MMVHLERYLRRRHRVGRRGHGWLEKLLSRVYSQLSGYDYSAGPPLGDRGGLSCGERAQLLLFHHLRSFPSSIPIFFHPRFRFGMEGWKALNPTQSICQNSDQGRPRAARAAKKDKVSISPPQYYICIYYIYIEKR